MLQLTEVSKRFYGTGFTLHIVSLCIGRGLHVLVGPNGAGKSTLLRIMAAVMRPDTGSVSFDGWDIYTDLPGYKLRLGYLPQVLGFYDHMTGMEFLRYMAGLKGISPGLIRERTDYVANLLGIRRYCTREIATWSVGLRQRLGLAQALLNDPAILVLDEPFCGLDPQDTDEVGQLLARLARDKVVFVSSHIMDKLDMNRLVLLVEGNLRFSGLPAAFLDAALGQVWAVEIARGEWRELQHRYPNGTAMFMGDRCRYIIISGNRPDIPGSKAINPGFEEAYTFWLANSHTDGKGRYAIENRKSNGL